VLNVVSNVKPVKVLLTHVLNVNQLTTEKLNQSETNVFVMPDTSKTDPTQLNVSNVLQTVKNVQDQLLHVLNVINQRNSKKLSKTVNVSVSKDMDSKEKKTQENVFLVMESVSNVWSEETQLNVILVKKVEKRKKLQVLNYLLVVTVKLKKATILILLQRNVRNVTILVELVPVQLLITVKPVKRIQTESLMLLLRLVHHV